MDSLALDLETHLITPTDPLPKPVSIAVCNDDFAPSLALFSSQHARYALENYHIVGAHIAFDMAVIYEHVPAARELVFEKYVLGEVSDILIADRMLDIGTKGWTNKVYNLATVTQKYCGVKLAKGADTWRKKYGELDGIPVEQWPAEADQYARDDARYSWAVWKRLQERDDLLQDLQRQTFKAFWLSLSSVWGLKTEQQMVDKMADTIGRQVDSLRGPLIDAGLVRPGRTNRNGRYVKPSKNKKAVRELVKRAFDAKGKDTPRTDSDDISTSADTCNQSGDPLLIQYGKYTALETKLTKEVKELRAEGSYVIRPRWTTPLVTGRTSTSPNVQNFGRDGLARACVIPRPGYIFLDADYGGLELATFAQVLLWIVGWSKLAESINQGIDVHLRLATFKLGIDYAEAKRLYDAGDETIDDVRGAVKPANFGFPGGGGAPTFVEYCRAQWGITYTLEEAKELKRLWQKATPEAKPYFDYINRLDGKVMHFKSNRFRNHASYCAACNSFFQGLGADVTGDAGGRISRACYTRQPCQFCKGAGCELCGRTGVDALYGARIVNYIHDEYLLEVLEEQGHYAAMSLIAHMNAAARDWVPDVLLTAEPVLMRRWYKKAKPVWKEGKLQIWEPKKTA